MLLISGRHSSDVRYVLRGRAVTNFFANLDGMIPRGCISLIPRRTSFIHYASNPTDTDRRLSWQSLGSESIPGDEPDGVQESSDVS